MEEKIFSRKRFLLSKYKKKKSTYIGYNNYENNLCGKENRGNEKKDNRKYIKYNNNICEQN